MSEPSLQSSSFKIIEIKTHITERLLSNKGMAMLMPFFLLQSILVIW